MTLSSWSVAARKGYRWCTKGEHWRAERFFSGPRAKTCSACLKKGRSKATHEARVMGTYGLLKGEYEALFKAQDGRCAICRQTRSQRLSVDHDHKTGLVRGLCCRLCNGRLLTAARDKPEVLRSAAEYLEAPPARRIIGDRFYQGKSR
jgi:hypothetical protein